MVVNWFNNGYDIKHNIDRITNKVRSGSYNENYILKEGLTWTYITSGPLGVRYVPKGFLFDNKGSMVFFKNQSDLFLNIAFLCSKLAQVVAQILNPTISFQPGNMSTMPSPVLEMEKTTIIKIVESNIILSKYDWDSFETSWDFKRNPLL